MAIYITDNSDNISGKASIAIGSFSTDFDGDYTAPGGASFDGSLNRSLGRFSVSFKEVNNHPKSKNPVAAAFINSVFKIHDNTDPLHLIARVCDFAHIQELGWFTAAERANTIPDFEDIIDSNPYIWMSVHDSPLHNNPMFRTVSSSKHHFRYEYVAQNRGDAIVYIDHDNLDEVPVNRETSTTLPTKQTGYQLNIANNGVATRMANLVSDMLSGTNLSGESLGGNDVSANIGWMFDGSDYRNPKWGARLLNTRLKGSVVSIVSSNSQQPIEIELDGQPALPTTGTLPEDASYGAVDNVDSIVLQPSSQATNGIMGLHIIGYKATSGGKSQVYCKLLSSLAHSTQTYTPGAGDLWNITNRNSGTTDVDWDADGLSEPWQTTGHDLWTGGLINFWTQVENNLRASSLNYTHRTINTISGSFLIKRAQGLPTSFGYKGQLDTPNAEHAEDQFKFFALSSTGSHGYDTSNVDIERGLRMIGWSKLLIRNNPGGNLNSRVRGPTLEFASWGNGDYSDVNELDAIYGLFYWAVCQLAGDVMYMGGSKSFQARPILIEECFVDIDTNFTEPNPVFTYDDSGGALGTLGYPTGSVTFDTPDFGERGFIRRRGDWLIAVNLADPPVDYPSTYNPNQQAGGGYTPRNPEDTVLPADFTALETAGIIESSDVLTEYDPSTYINSAVTTAFREQNPTKWNGFSYGPRQTHPDEATYTLANNPAIARNTANDGSTIDRSVAYGIGPLEARLWKIN